MITKTGIVATLGPASAGQDLIRQFIENGVTTFRLNFSHGDEPTHEVLLQTIRQVEGEFPHAVAVMGDLSGPKIRIGSIEPDGGPIREGEQVIISREEGIGTPERFSTNYPELTEDVRIGQRILLDDGNLVLRAEEKTDGCLRCRVIVGGPLHSRKGINLPDTEVRRPAITQRDWQWVDWAIAHDLDYLALSFVQHSKDVLQLKQHLQKMDSPIKVIAKIEKPKAMDDIEAIIHASDALLVARGDLGVEMPAAEVPLVQKDLTRLCRRLGKPVIVATQVLQSMIERPTPTRAEVSDIANAVMDYSDAVMLSGETAVGKYPLKAIQVMREVCGKTEAYVDAGNIPRPPIETDATLQALSSITRNVAHMVDEIDCALVVVATKTGTTTRLMSKARIDVPILSFCPNVRMNRQNGIYYGVINVLCPVMTDIRQFVAFAEAKILQYGWAKVGQQILILPGQELLPKNTNHAIVLHTLSGSE